MSENYIVINGKKAELTPEQLKALGIEVKKPSPFDTPDIGDEYFFISTYGQVLNAHEGGPASCDRYLVANYCTDKDLIQQRAYHETLNRLLWRFSMENGGDKIVWNGDNHYKYYLYYNHIDKTWYSDWSGRHQVFGVCYFESKEIAQQAIEEIVKPFMESHPDFKL